MKVVIGQETPSRFQPQVPGGGASPPRSVPPRLSLGHLPLDMMRLGEVLVAIEERVRAGKGGLVLTPGVEHVVLAEKHKGLREAFATASLCLAGSRELVRAVQGLGRVLPDACAGGKWLLPLMHLAREREWRVFLLAEGPGCAERAAEVLQQRFGVKVVGLASPMPPADGRGPMVDRLLTRIQEARPDLVLVSMRAPKQELLCRYAVSPLRPAVLIGIGSALESLVGTTYLARRDRRAVGPGWLGRLVWRLVRPLCQLQRHLAFGRILRRMERTRRMLPVRARH